MAIQTRLTTIATPGRPYLGFTAKTEAVPGSGPHTGGPFTELSVAGLPGGVHSFLAKTAAGGASGPHTGLFTTLSVSALPGMRQAFIAKAAAAVTSTKKQGGKQFLTQQAEAYNKHRARIIREDEEFMEILAIAIQKGILN